MTHATTESLVGVVRVTEFGHHVPNKSVDIDRCGIGSADIVADIRSRLLRKI